MFKKIFSLLFVAVLFMGLSAFAEPATISVYKDSVGIRVDGSYISTTNFLLDGSTYIPLRAVSESMGFSVTYNQETNTAIIDTTAKTEKKVENYAYVVSLAEEEPQNLEVHTDLMSIIIDGQKLNETNFLFDGTTYIPLRAVANAMSCHVYYDEPTKSARIYSLDYMNFLDNEVLMIGDERLSNEDLLDIAKYVYNGNIEAGVTDKFINLEKFLISYLSAVKIMEKSDINPTQEELTKFSTESNADELIKQLDLKNNELFQRIMLKQAYFSNGLSTGLFNDKLIIAYEPEDEQLILAFAQSPYATGVWQKSKHILIADEKLAKETYEKIKKGEDFDKLMVELSEDPGLQSAPDGYLFTEGQFIKEFETTSTNLKAGEVSEPVLGQFGYHIIKKVADYPNGVPFTELKDGLSQAIAVNNFQMDILNSRINTDVALNDKALFQ